MPVAVVAFTRDLRITDHPALAHACAHADRVVPLFVLDDAILGGDFNRPNRTGYLLESLTALDDALRGVGGRLVIRRGNWVDEVVQLARDTGATAVHVSDDVSGYARRRVESLAARAAGDGIEVHTHDGCTVVPPGAVAPADSDHYKVFTHYHRRWSEAPRRRLAPTPEHLRLPDGVEPGSLPALADLVDGERSPDVQRGGTDEAHARLEAWVDGHLREYGDRHDDLPGDATSHLSADLHLGCASPLEALRATSRRAGAAAFVRQLCWRDFFAQILAARPDAAWDDFRSRGDRWNDDHDALEAWKEGRTGYPVVDAGMRQLRAEGYMHNRARLVVASFLTKDLYLDWRHGARHFLDLLIDGDIANNNLNWQWVAGTGTDTNPHRVFNPTVQGKRFDPDGEYVRRYVHELAALRGPDTHDPDESVRRAYDYPPPLVEHQRAIAEYRDRV